MDLCHFGESGLYECVAEFLSMAKYWKNTGENVAWAWGRVSPEKSVKENHKCRDRECVVEFHKNYQKFFSHVRVRGSVFHFLEMLNYVKICHQGSPSHQC